MLKKAILISSIFLFTFLSSAQTTSFSSHEESIYKGLRRINTSFSFNENNASTYISYAKFISDKLLLGGGFGLGLNKLGSEFTYFNVSPFINYYYFKTFYVGTGVTYNRTWADNSFEADSWSLSTYASLGYDHFITPNIAFTPRISQSFILDDSINSRSRSGRINFTGSLSFFF